MTPEKRKMFLLIAILAAATGSYMEAMRHEKLKEPRGNPVPSAAPAGSAPANPTH